MCPGVLAGAWLDLSKLPMTVTARRLSVVSATSCARRRLIRGVRRLCALEWKTPAMIFTGQPSVATSQPLRHSSRRVTTRTFSTIFLSRRSTMRPERGIWRLSGCFSKLAQTSTRTTSHALAIRLSDASLATALSLSHRPSLRPALIPPFVAGCSSAHWTAQRTGRGTKAQEFMNFFATPPASSTSPNGCRTARSSLSCQRSLALAVA